MKQLFFFCLLCYNSIWLQAQIQDFGISNDISIEKRLSKTLALRGLTSTSLLQNAREWGWTFTDAGITLRLTRNWQISGHYRYVWRQNRRNETVNRQLLYAQAIYAKSLGNISVSWRGRILRQWYGADWSDNYRPTLWQIRNRVALKYKQNYYWQPNISAEIFIPLIGQNRGLITQWRTTLGLDYNLNDFNEFTMYLQYNRSIGKAPQYIRYLLGTAYSLRL